MKPDYWKKRSEQIARRQFIKADAFEVAQRKEYDRAMKSMQRDIEVFYQRYATNNEVTMAEARKQLTAGELKEFKMTLEEFTEKAKDNADGRWTQELNNVYYKTRVTRLEALQTQIGQHSEMLAGSRQESTEKLLGDIYTDTYYRNIYEIQKGFSIGGSFAHVDDEGLKKVLGSKLDGRNWSQRIWDDRSKVRQELQRNLSQSFIRGDSIDRTVKSVIERMSVSRSNAERLVQTESAFFAGQATATGYKESGVVQQYEVLATLDTRTSSVCREMDGKVFKLSEMEVNVNYPPFHARCRTTTVAHFDDDEDIGERIAMDPDGNTYFVPGDMNYEDWYQKHVVDKYGQEELDIMSKKVLRESADKNQFNQYKEVLGNKGPKSFAAFQDMKYNKPEEWLTTKSLYRDVNWQLKAQGNLLTGSVHKVEKIGVPNSVFDNYKDGKLESRRYYGNTGKTRLDIDLTNHRNAKMHPIVPHAHTWGDKIDAPDGISREIDGRELTLAEKIANKNIIGKDR
ncbi:minor capsid protein [Paenibacillus macquariensis]|uniref:Phage putative head morphogenesis protein, SPP1 gp7 family n=1 Tax=Paenibacillus macquariensis TaxID=948756 RepID=A0ABY1JXD8_9BACL|nr:minor capsid protein [Paenibacillus macquariensis]MEC0089342.1 minor capsid protein [Paenibacillus macquariensis]SIQ93411.1 phage putative head morphogenesis protein, SPP1 gp7 family [Paenibacillus macquariensis]